MAADADGTLLRVLLLGTAGAGKSSTGNTLLGREAFTVTRGHRYAGIQKCRRVDARVNDTILQVVNTPGFNLASRPKEEILRDIKEYTNVDGYAPHVSLIVIRCDCRFTQEDYENYCILKKELGIKVLKRTIVVFTGMEDCGDTLEEQRASLERDVAHAPTHVKKVMADAGNRFFGINNRASEEEKRQQAVALIDMMKDQFRISMAAEEEHNVLRVVIIGKTGTGKSAVGNTLLGLSSFTETKGILSGTDKCQWGYTEMADLLMQVTDTPGLSDSHRPHEDVVTEVGKSVAVSSPGPHVILLVIKLDRFTLDDYEVYTNLKGIFGKEIKTHMIIVFTGIDIFEGNLEEQRRDLRMQLTQAPPNLKEFLADAGNRSFGINNRASKEEKRHQALELTNMMKELKRQRGDAYFQNDISKRVTYLVNLLVRSRMASRDILLAEAIRETNRAIIDEKESAWFYHQLRTIFRNGRGRCTIM